MKRLWLIVDLFASSGHYLYDNILPAIITAGWIILAVWAGVISKELAVVCFCLAWGGHALLASGARTIGKSENADGRH